MRDGLPVLDFATVGDWEGWLTAQAADSRGRWLGLAGAGSGIATFSKQQAIDAALCFGWIDGQQAPLDEVCWLTRFTPRRKGSKWSRVNRDRAEVLEGAGRLRAGCGKFEAARADGRWQAAHAPQGEALVPDDLAAALAANPVARAFFATLTGANRYAVRYRIGDAKRPQTRAARIGKFAGMPERGEVVYPRQRSRRPACRMTVRRISYPGGREDEHELRRWLCGGGETGTPRGLSQAGGTLCQVVDGARRAGLCRSAGR